MKLATVAEMRELERAAVEAGSSYERLMEEAGHAAAREGWMLLGAMPGADVVVLAGPGNNGGDALVAARHLHDWGCHVRVFIGAARPVDQLSSALSERGIDVENPDHGTDTLDAALTTAGLVVDGLLGTGQSRAIEESSGIGQCLAVLAEARGKADGPALLALDVPSGLDADSGAADPLTVAADMTVTFGLAKVGLFQHPGMALAGTVEVADIGLPGDAGEAVRQELLSARTAAGLLPRRRADSNKGSFGRVLCAGGSRQYSGAIQLSARAAYRAGAGLVTIACPEGLQAMIAPALPEATWLPLDANEDGGIAEGAAIGLRARWQDYDAAVIGPGMGNSEATRALLWAALPDLQSLRQGAVIDADALNAIAALPDASERVPPSAVLTPHPGEMARLLGVTTAEVQQDRPGAAREAAKRFGCTVVLKGAGTVIAGRDGLLRISPFANPLLATAGTGDVLAGCIAAYLAQGLGPFDAAALGVFVHGLAADHLSDRYGPAGLLASELADALPVAAWNLRG